MSVMKAKVPAAIATGVICLAVGGGLGAAIMAYAAGKPEQQAQAAQGDDGAAKGPGDAKGPDAKGGKGGFGGGKGGGGGGGPKGPNPKVQLTQLVSKLDVLTRGSLHVDLTPEQKKELKEQLAGLEAKEEITEEEAKAKFEALAKILEANKKTFEDAGYRWPGTRGGGGGGGFGGGGGGPAPPPPNPFKAGDGADRLKSLQATLGK